ncbi:hypothetical protein [Pontiella sulfatireligans]|uniref:Uncharacterized protein n=1 Tax=Pontiella sulfatireligans TaxID=2750658 RepID=A0A6C2ULY4_9BACT|nr:hypothetical protein [Pontiella sulfatireligans]VGO20979.1 hypothetical protein SCARR_03048 [Pontiella sulfatireligans]
MNTITGIATLVATIVAWIGYQQHKLAKEKFKLDLFEKRFSVYKGVQEFLIIILQEGAFEFKQLATFNAKTQDGTFLFGSDIPDYINRIYKDALRMRTVNVRLEHLPVGDERNLLCEEESQLLEELAERLSSLPEIFAPYLRFEKWK